MVARHETLPLTSLRGVACVWVVAHHLQPVLFPDAAHGLASTLLLGHVAVDIFFVLSGFILARLYGAIPLADAPAFWLRRVCRVYPLHVAIMLALGGMALLTTWLGVNHTNHDWPAYPYVLALVQPYALTSVAWNSPSWSVGIELGCYASFPFIARLLWRMPARLMPWLVMLLAILEAAVLARCDGVVEGPGAILRGLGGFLLGMALAGTRPLRPGPAAAMAWLALAGVAGGVAAGSAQIVVLAASVLIAALAVERGTVARLLSAKALVWLGQISFSIYLLHGPLLVLVERLRLPGGNPSRAAFLLLVLLPLSALTHRFIEQPGRRLPGRLLRARTRAGALI